MKKMFFLLSAFLMLLCSSCVEHNNDVGIYYVSSGGSSSSISIDGIDEVYNGRSWPDPEAETEKHLDFLGMSLEGNYSETYQSCYRTKRDEYECYKNGKILSFIVDRKTSKILSYHYNYTRDYIWPENQTCQFLTEKECLDIANDYLEKYTELYSNYSLLWAEVDDPHLPNWPVSYYFIFELNNGIMCNQIYIKIRSDGELTDISQHNYLDFDTYEALGKVDIPSLYNIGDKALKKKLGNIYDDYYIDRSDNLPNLAISSAGRYQIAISYDISVNPDEPYPNQLIVFIPIENCIVDGLS